MIKSTPFQRCRCSSVYIKPINVYLSTVNKTSKLYPFHSKLKYHWRKKVQNDSKTIVSEHLGTTVLTGYGRAIAHRRSQLLELYGKNLY